MKGSILGARTAGLVMLALGASGAACAPAGTATPAAMASAGWRPLFDGKDLSNWKIPDGDNGHWKVLDGVIDYDAASEAPGDKNLWTKESFRNFELRVDWRLKEYSGIYQMPIVLPDGTHQKDASGNDIKVGRPNADSGIYLRGTSKAQMNIWMWPIGSGEVSGYRVDPTMPPDVVAGVTPKKRMDRPIGEWNTFVIRLEGEILTVQLNGETVIERARLPGVPATGPIALQHHGGPKPNPAASLIQFRNIYIRELP